jgi:two-component system sensor histidine kinase KdpD
VAVFIALMVKSVIEPHLTTSPPFITFLAAIMFVAWAWGLRPAVFATVLSAVVIDYSVILPLQSFTVTLADFGSLLFFSVVAITMAYTIDRLQTRQREAVAIQRQVEHIHQLSTRLFEEKNLEQTVDSILKVALDLLHTDKGLLQLQDVHDKTLRLRAQVGFSEAFCRAFEQSPLG